MRARNLALLMQGYIHAAGGRGICPPFKNLFINNALFTFQHDNRTTNRRMSRSMWRPPERRLA
jgi:hypothetical protein